MTGGENVAAAEVEEALVSHPAVTDAAVVGRPDPEWGEAVTAFVVLDGEASDAELIRRPLPRAAGGLQGAPRDRARGGAAANGVGEAAEGPAHGLKPARVGARHRARSVRRRAARGTARVPPAEVPLRSGQLPPGSAAARVLARCAHRPDIYRLGHHPER